MFKKPKPVPVYRSKVAVVVSPPVDLSKFPAGMSFEEMDRIILRRGGASI